MKKGVEARKKDSGWDWRGRREYIRVVFMSLGWWARKKATRNWSGNIFCWIKLSAVPFNVCLCDLTSASWVVFYIYPCIEDVDRAIDVSE